ncbi:hypothetical protein F5Y16DRAFT_420344 [Xylariaceae sp. FL0255]|nr:hypothetical protein F5Y16DRAFT_420344 [Xylariaceae sp. FL0255]
MASNSTITSYYPVHLGFWTNWSRGPVFGSTLTLNQEGGNLLIAFTAVFIGFVSSRGWKIISFALHRVYASDAPQGTIHHQQQVNLRNSSDSQSSIHQLSQLLWANRYNRIWPPTLVFTVVVAAIFTISSAIAGGFSSQISGAVGPEALIETANCGWLSTSSLTSTSDYFLVNPMEASNINNAVNYAEQCYSNNGTGTLECGTFITNKIAAQVNASANCPFQGQMCRSQSANIRIDSGFIDSHEHLGLNTPPEQRMKFRHVMHCAPLITYGYTNAMSTDVGEVIQYHYGNTSGSTGAKDFLYTARPIQNQYAEILSPDTILGDANYLLDVATAYVTKSQVNPLNSDFIPIDALFRADADIDLFFLVGNGVFFTNQSTDDWYRVSQNIVTQTYVTAEVAETMDYYLPSEAASPLGCAEQWQFCGNSTQYCGKLASFNDATVDAAPLFNISRDQLTDWLIPRNITADGGAAARYRYLVETLNVSPTVKEITSVLGSATLTSQSSLIKGVQGPLVSNQWHLDVAHLHDASLAAFQAAFLQTSYFNPANPAKIRSTAHSSFSVFGLFFIYLVGILTILISYLLEPLAKLLYKKGYDQYPYLEWTTNATLQLHRLAQEERGFGTWSGGKDKVPVTQPGDILGSLDLTNPDHPILQSPDTQHDDPSLAAKDSADSIGTQTL